MAKSASDFGLLIVISALTKSNALFDALSSKSLPLWIIRMKCIKCIKSLYHIGIISQRETLTWNVHALFVLRVAAYRKIALSMHFLMHSLVHGISASSYRSVHKVHQYPGLVHLLDIPDCA